MKKLEQLYEGKAKKVFKTDDPKCLIVDYKDDATAFNGEKKGQIVGKGVVNNTMTNIILQLLEQKGVPTHYVEQISDRDDRKGSEDPSAGSHHEKHLSRLLCKEIRR